MNRGLSVTVLVVIVTIWWIGVTTIIGWVVDWVTA